jgi:hypothetical protein
MGFFIGWKYYDDKDYYSEDAIRDRNDQAAGIRSAERRAEKERRNRKAARRREKKKIQDEQYEQTNKYQELFNQTYGSGNPSEYGQDPNDPSSLYQKFSSPNKDAYQKETERRYGYLYNSYTDGQAPSLSRGLGINPHQNVKRPQNVKHHSPLGPFAHRIRISLGWQPNTGGQNSQSVASARMEEEGQSSQPSGAFGTSTKLGRPL